MHEVFGVLGQIVVDDVCHVGDVDTAGSDVGGNEDAMAALREAAKSGVPLRLGAVAMNLRSGTSRTRTRRLATRSAPCLVRTKTRKLPFSPFREVLQKLEFVALFDFKRAKFDVLCRLEHRADFDADRVLEILAATSLTAPSRVAE